MAPHSSDSTWPKPIQRNFVTGMTCSSAARTKGNMARGPQ
jgi:hypothetical protein